MTLLLMASCGVGNSSQYKQGDPAPSINTDQSTINGRHYDNKTAACWKLTFTYRLNGGDSKSTVSETSYVWCTEFALVETQEMMMWTAAQLGKYASASYAYIRTTDGDSESCLKHNNE